VEIYQRRGGQCYFPIFMAEETARSYLLLADLKLYITSEKTAIFTAVTTSKIENCSFRRRFFNTLLLTNVRSEKEWTQIPFFFIPTATSAELSVPTSKSCHLYYDFFLDLLLMFSFFKTVFDSRQMKNLDTAKDRKRNPHYSCSFFTQPTHDKKQTNKLTNSTEQSRSCNATISVT
jgi:hypothetical protein